VPESEEATWRTGQAESRDRVLMSTDPQIEIQKATSQVASQLGIPRVPR
jgi:hypothetical protein